MEQFVRDLEHLFQNRWHDDQVRLNVAEVRPGSNRVGGYMVWGGFESRSQHERQNLVWQELRTLPPEQQQQISAILTLTPLEESAIMENE